MISKVFSMRFGGRALQSILGRFVELAAIAFIMLALNGCGSDLAEVTGLVTLDGQPLRGGNDVRATVCFQPASGAGTAAIGLLDENGQYRLSSGSKEGVPPGEYFVTCSATQLVTSKEGQTGGGRRITDPNYANAHTSGFKFTVEPGHNEFNLPLNSRPAAANGNSRRPTAG